MFYATGVPGWMRFGGYPRPFPQEDSETEKQALRNEAKALQAELDAIKSRLTEMENDPNRD
jgi:hypothetical protein